MNNVCLAASGRSSSDEECSTHYPFFVFLLFNGDGDNQVTPSSSSTSFPHPDQHYYSLPPPLQPLLTTTTTTNTTMLTTPLFLLSMNLFIVALLTSHMKICKRITLNTLGQVGHRGRQWYSYNEVTSTATTTTSGGGDSSSGAANANAATNATATACGEVGNCIIDYWLYGGTIYKRAFYTIFDIIKGSGIILQNNDNVVSEEDQNTKTETTQQQRDEAAAAAAAADKEEGWKNNNCRSTKIKQQSADRSSHAMVCRCQSIHYRKIVSFGPFLFSSRQTKLVNSLLPMY